MATNRIKGITIEIGGDTTKLQTALKGMNTDYVRDGFSRDTGDEVPSFRFKPKMPEKIVAKIVVKCQDSQRYDKCGA